MGPASHFLRSPYENGKGAQCYCGWWLSGKLYDDVEGTAEVFLEDVPAGYYLADPEALLKCALRFAESVCCGCRTDEGNLPRMPKKWTYTARLAKKTDFGESDDEPEDDIDTEAPTK
jgi:hypothetical protein